MGGGGVQGTVGAGRWVVSRDSWPRSRLSPVGLGEAQAGLRAHHHRRCWGAGRAEGRVGPRVWWARGLMEQRIDGAGFSWADELVGRGVSGMWAQERDADQ